MAHELEIKDGRASFFAVKDTAWHGEGIILSEAPTYAEAMKLGRLDYDVEKRPTYIIGQDGENAGALKASEFSFVTVRTDTEEELGQVGTDYVPMQNTDAFRVIEPLVDQGVARLETGGVLRRGADAWLLIQWDLSKFGPIVREVFTNEIAPFGLLANNHDRRRGILLQDTNIRVVCANTLGFAEGSTERRIVVKHSDRAKSNLVEAAETMWGGIIERYEKLAVQYRVLKNAVLEEEEFTRYVLDVIAPRPQDQPSFNPEANLAEMVIARNEKKRTTLRGLWEHGKGHVGDHSAWEAYNAAAEALDHNKELWPTRNGAWRTASLMTGGLKQMKDRVLSDLVLIGSGRAA